MACSSCNNGNSLSSCGCVDNCPTKTSEFTFDGVFSSIPVPAGSTLNEVLLLMETFTMNSIGSLNLNYELTFGNCLGLLPGTYSYQQMIDAISVYICDMQAAIIELQGGTSLTWNDIPLINGWYSVDAINNPAQYAIGGEFMYLKGEITIDYLTYENAVFWDSVPMSGITRDIKTMGWDPNIASPIPILVSASQMNYWGSYDGARGFYLDSIPVIRLTN